MATTGDVLLPQRFCLLADNMKYVSRWREPTVHGSELNYEVNCIGEERDAPQVVLEIGEGHPSLPNATKLRHVETGNWGVQSIGIMRLFTEQTISTLSLDFYFWLEPVDLRNNRGRLHCTAVPRPANTGEVPPDTSFVRFSRPNAANTLYEDMLAATWTMPNLAPTIFTVYDSALSTVWRQIDFFLDRAITENVEVFSRSVFRFDNSNFDQMVTLRPTISLTETMETNWSRSRAFGFSQSISITSKIPFVAEVELGFTAEQSFEIDNGGAFTRTVEHSVQVDVPVPPFRIVEVIVTGYSGKLSIPFRLVEVATYTDGVVRERTLDDGFCSNVSSVTTEWSARYADSQGRQLNQDDLPFPIPKGSFSY